MFDSAHLKFIGGGEPVCLEGQRCSFQMSVNTSSVRTAETNESLVHVSFSRLHVCHDLVHITSAQSLQPPPAQPVTGGARWISAEQKERLFFLPSAST